MKKLIKVLLVSILAMSMVACGSKDNPGTDEGTSTETIVLKVWASQEDQSMVQGMIDEFKAANADKTYDITLGVVSEADAKARYLEDPEAAADVFAFANDQLVDLVNAGALYEVTRNKDAIVAANVEGSVEAASLDGKLYAYPMTADNGYFLYYDSSVFTEEDVKSLDTMLEVANAAGKQVFMDVSNGYYIASFFLGAGLGFEDDGTIQWNNETGVKVVEAIRNFTENSAFITGDDAILKAGIGDTIAAGVSGQWNADDITSILGENFAAAKLPEYTLDGVATQMGSFLGYKLVGVNSQTANPVEAMNLAEWLTNEANQVVRFETRKLGPSNINAANSEAVLANAALSALAAQSNYAVSQNNVPGAYWTPAEGLGNALETKDYSMSIEDQLEQLVSQTNAE